MPVKISFTVLSGVVVISNLREQTNVVGNLTRNKETGRRKRQSTVFLEISGWVIALGGVADFGRIDNAHHRKGKRAGSHGVAGHFEHAAVGRKFRELAAGVTSNAVLTG